MTARLSITEVNPMKHIPSRRVTLTGLLLVATVAGVVGCGDGRSGDGAMASPVDPAQAAQQNKAMQDFLKSKMKTAKRR
jgi:hypothetical protein